jgi:hypothetical protein
MAVGTAAARQLDKAGVLDAFGRLRAGLPFTLIDSKMLIDDDPFFWSEELLTGATAPYDADRSSKALTVTSTPGSKATRQTKQYINYQPGKSLAVHMTMVMGPEVAGIRERVGPFDADNGVFLERNGSALRWVLRSSVTGSPVDTVVEQADWNIDKLDGQITSDADLDPEKAQILAFDLQWLGVGRVRCGFVIDGVLVYTHEFLHSNLASSVYMTTPNLPLRYEIENVSAGSGAVLEQVCADAISEGGFEALGATLSADRGATVFTTASTTDLYSLIGIRLKAGYVGATIHPTDFSVLDTSSTNFRWALILNPTVAGSDAASWVSVPNSAIEYDISRDSTNNLSGGIVLASGYAGGAGGPVKTAEIEKALRSGLVVSADIAGNRDELVLAVQNLVAGAETYYGGLSWRELF